jgi:hypothetical protein
MGGEIRLGTTTQVSRGKNQDWQKLQYKQGRSYSRRGMGEEEEQIVIDRGKRSG